MRGSSQIKHLHLLLPLGILLLLLILASFNPTWATANSQETSTGSVPVSLDAPAASRRVYLPMIMYPKKCGGGTIPCRIRDAR